MTIEELRTRIDEIDDQLVSLLNARAACALAIGRLKRSKGLRVCQPQRETDVLRRVRRVSAASGPLKPGSLARLFRHIIADARALQARAGRHE